MKPLRKEVALFIYNFVGVFTSGTLTPAEEIVHFEGKKFPSKEITIQDKAIVEKVNLISQPDEKEKNVVYTIVESFLSKKRFKDFVQQNVAL